MDGGLLLSPVHPIGMSAHPGSLKTAFSITAYNEGGFISALSKCQSSINANAQTRMPVVWLFSAWMAFLVIALYLISLSALKFPHSSSCSPPLSRADSVSSSSSSSYLDHRMRPQVRSARWLHVSSAPVRASWGKKHYSFQRRRFKQPSST